MAERMLNNFLIGCDPEFAGIGPNGQPIQLARGIPHETNDEIGSDHNGWVAELHPTPHHGTYMLVKKLQRIINNLPANLSAISKLRAGGYIQGRPITRRPITLGGHIHLDIPHQGVERIHRIGALNLLTQCLEALDILPKRESEQRRALGDYGQWGDVRVDKGRTEYRTMASWLDKPQIAMICLTGAKLAVVDPNGTLTNLPQPSKASLGGLKNWFESYKSKDINARRVAENILESPIKTFQSTPGEEFRPGWRELTF